MNRPALSIITFGIDPNIARRANDRLVARGIDAESYVVSNTPTSDAEITRALTSKNWDGIVIGAGLKKQSEWYERVLKLVKDVNPNVPLIQSQGLDHLEEAIEHQFKIQLPPTPT